VGVKTRISWTLGSELIDEALHLPEETERLRLFAKTHGVLCRCLQGFELRFGFW
jgi:hypothetical protein